MTTSLADQLKRFSKPQTTNLERGKTRASLLFDPKEAAGFRKETFYHIGLNGLEELIARDEVFEQFTKTLFSLDSREFERSIESSSDNAKLNKHINKFLLLLSPHILLPCSFKALEWMIYRYSIHQYNREDLLMLVFPYHETNVFRKIVALLKFEDVNDHWTFLSQSQKAGVPLTNQQLLNHASSDPYFIQFISDFILKIIKIHEKPNMLTVAFTLYNKVFSGAIEYAKGTPESIITQMLPALLKGLNSPILDFKAASYIITARLVTKSILSDVLLDKFMEKISSNDGTHLQKEAVLLYAISYQSQLHYKNVPEAALAEIIAQQWFPKTLQDLNNTGTYIDPFLEALVKKVVESGIEDDAEHYRSFLVNLLDQLNIDEGSVAKILNAIIDSIPIKLKKKQPEVKTWLIEVIKKIETQYPTQFDNQVYKILTLTENEDRKILLQKVLRHEMRLKKKFDIFDKLYDSNALLRIDAINFISTNYEELRDEEKDILKISLEHRLKDDNFEVVNKALGMIKKTNIIQGAVLNKILCELLLRCYKDKYCWGKVLTKLLRILCAKENSSNFNVIAIIFPLLLPKTNEEIVIAKQVIASDFFINCPLFKTFNAKAKLTIAGDFPNELFKCLKAPGNVETISDLYNKIDTETIQKFSPIQKYSLALLMSNSVDKKFPLEKLLPLLEILEKISIDGKTSSKTDCSILENLKIAKKGILPLSGYLECIFNMVTFVDKVECKLLDFSSKTPSTKFLLACCSFFYNESAVHQTYFHKFNEAVSVTADATIGFILHLAVYKESCGSITQNLILNILSKELKSCIISGFFDLMNKYIPFLLILMTSPDEDIRKRTFEICEIIARYPRENQAYASLFQHIMDHQEEIILDSSQLPIIVSNALKPIDNFSTVIMETLIKFCTNPQNPSYLVAATLKIISNVNNINILDELSVFANSILEKNPKVFTEPESDIIHHCIKRYDSTIGKSLKKDLNAFKFLVSVLKNDKECLNIAGELISPSLLIMKQLNADFFSSLCMEVESVILDSIIEVSTNPQNPNILLASNKIFKHIDLNVSRIIPQLTDMEEIQSVNTSINKKRKRPSVVPIPTVDILDTLEWKKGVRVLELIQDKKKMTKVKALIPKLFGILKKCLNFEEQIVVEYPKQLILSLVLICCQKLENVKLSENSFHMELVVQCIRASSNPQTHHHALLVLAHCASLFPNQVLHHIMAIFTFMGSSVLRHDDNYSFQLIFRIIDSVIPILISDGSIETIISVLRVFVDALLDVPEHRRLKLYTRLLEKIDAEKHMHLFLQLVFVSQVLHGLEDNRVKKNYKFEDHSTIKRLYIAIELIMEFAPSVGFNACKKLIHNLRSLPVERADLKKNSLEIDITDLTEKQFRNFKYTTLIFINNLISTKEFIGKIAVLSDDDLENLEPYYKDIIVGILSYIQKTHPILDKNKNSLYWKAIQNLSLEILDCMNALLTPEMFLLVIKGLMSHELSSIRKRSLDLLNSKLTSELFIEECNHNELHSTVDSLVAIIGKLNEDTNEDEMIVIQKALLSLKLIVKIVGSEDQDKYIEILAFITKLIKSNQTQDYVLSSLILCLVELCITLRAKAIEYLPSFMPVLLKILTQEKNKEVLTLLCISLLTAIQKIFEVLSLFISPYLKKMLYELSQLDGKWADSSDDPKLTQFVQKLKIIKSKLADNIPTRVLLPAIEECYSDVIEKNKLESIGPIMSILSENLRNLSNVDVTPHVPKLTQFFMTAFEFRNLELCDIKQINAIEYSIIEALCNLTLKLSASAFKPFFSRIFVWAEEEKNRMITFYHITNCLATRLKSLFMLFAGTLINNAAKILEDFNKKIFLFDNQDKNTLLLSLVLQTLNSVFQHCSGKFITKERFEILMSPIVDNLENDIDGMADLEKRTNKLIIPCIVHFTVATGDDSLWKQLNYQILLKMRNSNYKIRLISLRCLTEIVKRLGEDFLPLLPETIPFLSELLEDDHEVVQEQCKKSIQELEEVLGENLSKYF